MKMLGQFNEFRYTVLEKEMLGFLPFDHEKFGYFLFNLKNGAEVQVAADNAISNPDFEHVSISLLDRCPTWEEMCEVKDLFFNPEEAVYQIHPPESEYVNFVETCLHLWRPKQEFQLPEWTSCSGKVITFRLKNGTTVKFTNKDKTNMGFEHITVWNEERYLTWDEMCEIKDLFFKAEEPVYQIHFPTSQNGKIHQYQMDLWVPKKGYPRPPWRSVL